MINGTIIGAFVVGTVAFFTGYDVYFATLVAGFMLGWWANNWCQNNVLYRG